MEVIAFLLILFGILGIMSAGESCVNTFYGPGPEHFISIACHAIGLILGILIALNIGGYIIIK